MQENTNETYTFKNETEGFHYIQFLKSKNQNSRNSETTNFKLDTNAELKKRNIDENVNSNSKVLQKKVTEDGVTGGRILWEGEEASSSLDKIKTASFDSFYSNNSINGLDLIYYTDEDDFNITVTVNNEWAFRKRNRSDGKFSYCENKIKSSAWQTHKSCCVVNGYSSHRSNVLNGSSRKPKFQHKNSVHKNYNYGRRDRKSNERKHFDYSRTCDDKNDLSTHKDQVGNIRRRRWEETDQNSNRSRSTDSSGIFRSSITPERNATKQSPSHKDSKIEASCSRSFDGSSDNSSPERSIVLRKKRRNIFTEAPSSTLQMRPENHKSPNDLKTDEVNTHVSKNDLRYSFHNLFSKNERMPSVVESERKPREGEQGKSFDSEPNKSVDSKNTSENNSTLNTLSVSEINQKLNSSFLSTNIPPVSSAQTCVCPVQYPLIPSISVHNLPLVPGPSGLPVHVTPGGEQILHDMQGRPIPIGPNGYYLPIDPTGRIFPHIISPNNQAVPIHMTEDGVLRLPNSEPVPFGPPHQLPVNIDGKVILIGPDSRPLYPCPNLPKEPPLLMIEMRKLCRKEYAKKAIPHPPIPQITVLERTLTETKETQTEDQVEPQHQPLELSLVDFIENTSEEINIEEILKNYKNRARNNSEVVECTDLEEDLGVIYYNTGVFQRSIPTNLNKKSFKGDTYRTGPDMISGGMVFDDPNSASILKPVDKFIKGPVEKNKINLNEELDVLQIICDKVVPKGLTVENKSKGLMIEKIQRAIKLFYEKNYTSPKFGPFIVSETDAVPTLNNLPNESPLLRNRIRIPFLNPDDQIDIKEKSAINFNFLSGENLAKDGKHVRNKDKSSSPKISDFAMQCDFTSDIIKNLSCKVYKLEVEVARLNQINANLFNNCRKVQAAKQKKAEELKIALLEIQKKKTEIVSSKHSTDI